MYKVSYPFYLFILKLLLYHLKLYNTSSTTLSSTLRYFNTPHNPPYPLATTYSTLLHHPQHHPLFPVTQPSILPSVTTPPSHPTTHFTLCHHPVITLPSPCHKGEQPGQVLQHVHVAYDRAVSLASAVLHQRPEVQGKGRKGGRFWGR